MNNLQLKSKAKELGFTYSRHLAQTGSEYIKVDGRQFRIADHVQPSSYVIRNYTSVKSYDEIVKIISAPEFTEVKPEYVTENGQLFKVTYNSQEDDFIFEAVQN